MPSNMAFHLFQHVATKRSFFREHGRDSANMHWHQFVRIAPLALLIMCGPSSAAEFPNELRVILDNAEQFELLSLNPDRRAGKQSDHFHGWNILGRTAVTDVHTRNRLVAAFKKGVEENQGQVARCFNPRHGIRVTRDGKTVDFVICFECLSAQVYVGGKREKGLLTTGSPEATFDDVLRAAKIALAREQTTK